MGGRTAKIGGGGGEFHMPPSLHTNLHFSGVYLKVILDACLKNITCEEALYNNQDKHDYVVQNHHTAQTLAASQGMQLHFKIIILQLFHRAVGVQSTSRIILLSLLQGKETLEGMSILLLLSPIADGWLRLEETGWLA